MVICWRRTRTSPHTSTYSVVCGPGLRSQLTTSQASVTIQLELMRSAGSTWILDEVRAATIRRSLDGCGESSASSSWCSSVQVFKCSPSTPAKSLSPSYLQQEKSAEEQQAPHRLSSSSRCLGALFFLSLLPSPPPGITSFETHGRPPKSVGVDPWSVIGRDYQTLGPGRENKVDEVVEVVDWRGETAGE